MAKRQGSSVAVGSRQSAVAASLALQPLLLGKKGGPEPTDGPLGRWMAARASKGSLTMLDGGWHAKLAKDLGKRHRLDAHGRIRTRVLHAGPH